MQGEKRKEGRVEHLAVSQEDKKNETWGKRKATVSFSPTDGKRRPAIVVLLLRARSAEESARKKKKEKREVIFFIASCGEGGRRCLAFFDSEKS